METKTKTHLLKKGEFFLEIEEQGGNVINFSHRYESNFILFPRMDRADGKKRGGSHICFPYFGSVSGVKEQHGFGRYARPTFVQNGTPEKMELVFEGFSIFFEIIENGFKQKIVCTNPENFEIFNPGFHPYFYIPVALDGGKREATISFHSPEKGMISFKNENISGVSILEDSTKADGVNIRIKDHGDIVLRLESSEIENAFHFFPICLWRDDPSFVCVEPLYKNPKKTGDKALQKPFWMEMIIEFFPFY